MRMELPIHVSNIIKTLNMAGYEAYAVGGCVRDTLLNIVPKDWDITTSALPKAIKELFPRTIDTGIQHGTVTVMMDHIGYEVTTYRVDGEYEDGRHPKQVVFTASLLEDLKRRDFTINAMAYHPDKGLIDEFDGIGDLERRQIRCVGEAKQRFTEDALRILRAVRFSAQLDCTIEQGTLEGMCALASNLEKVSVERIYMELSKLLMSDHPEKFLYASQTKILPYVLPELSNVPVDRFSVMLERIRVSRKDLWVRLAILLSYAFAEYKKEDEAVCKQILRRLKTDLYTIKTVSRLVGLRTMEMEPTPIAVRKFLAAYGAELMDKWISLVEIMQEKELSEIRMLMNNALEQGVCISVKQLALDGFELKKLGVPQGKEVGEVLKSLLEEVLKHPDYNTKEALSAIAIDKLAVIREKTGSKQNK